MAGGRAARRRHTQQAVQLQQSVLSCVQGAVGPGSSRRGKGLVGSKTQLPQGGASVASRHCHYAIGFSCDQSMACRAADEHRPKVELGPAACRAAASFPS